MKARPVELSSRIGRIFWYSGELYQRFTASVSANSRMMTRFGSGPPSILAERIEAYMIKAVREGKQKSTHQGPGMLSRK